MTGKEILTGMDKLLDSHLKLGGSIQQEPYKGEFSKLFVDAHKNDYFRVSAHPRLTGDAIHDYFVENIVTEENAYNDRKLKLLDDVLIMWREWYYALNGAGIEIQNTEANLS
jgi:hypothetical protein